MLTTKSVLFDLQQTLEIADQYLKFNSLRHKKSEVSKETARILRKNISEKVPQDSPDSLGNLSDTQDRKIAQTYYEIIFYIARFMRLKENKKSRLRDTLEPQLKNLLTHLKNPWIFSGLFFAFRKSMPDRNPLLELFTELGNLPKPTNTSTIAQRLMSQFIAISTDWFQSVDHISIETINVFCSAIGTITDSGMPVTLQNLSPFLSHIFRIPHYAGYCLQYLSIRTGIPIAFMQGNTSYNEPTLTPSRRLGKGSFGVVDLAIYNRTTIQNVALKYPTKLRFYKDAILEIGITHLLQHGDHPNIIHMFPELTYIQNARPQLALEYCSQGSLSHFLKSRNYLTSEEEKYWFAQQLLSGIAHVHKHNVGHNDISLGNVLVTDNDTLKLSDFGKSHYFHNATEIKSMTTGTPEMLSPEVLKAQLDRQEKELKINASLGLHFRCPIDSTLHDVQQRDIYACLVILSLLCTKIFLYKACFKIISKQYANKSLLEQRSLASLLMTDYLINDFYKNAIEDNPDPNPFEQVISQFFSAPSDDKPSIQQLTTHFQTAARQQGISQQNTSK